MPKVTMMLYKQRWSLHGDISFIFLHRETYIEQAQGESANDRNDRAIRVAAKWYSEHLKKDQKEEGFKIILLTNDKKNKEKAEEAGLVAYTCKSICSVGWGIKRHAERSLVKL